MAFEVSRAAPMQSFSDLAEMRISLPRSACAESVAVPGAFAAAPPVTFVTFVRRSAPGQLPHALSLGT
jgi:hypothetical protein